MSGRRRQPFTSVKVPSSRKGTRRGPAGPTGSSRYQDRCGCRHSRSVKPSPHRPPGTPVRSGFRPYSAPNRSLSPENDLNRRTIGALSSRRLPSACRPWTSPFVTTAAVRLSPLDIALGDPVCGRHGQAGGAGGAAPARPGDRAAVPAPFVGRERSCQERLSGNFTRSSGRGCLWKRCPACAGHRFRGGAYLISTEAPASSS